MTPRTSSPALGTNPGDHEVLLRLGLVTAELGRFDEARDALKAYLEKRNKPTEAWTALARACDAVGDAEGAAFAYERVVVLMPDDIALQLAGGKGLSAVGEHEKALPSLERAANALADRAEAQAALGEALLGLRRFEAAGAALSKAVKLEPLVAGHHAALGRAEMGRGNLSRAAECLEQAVRLNGSDTDALLLLAEVYKRDGRPHDATSALRRAIAVRPDDASLHFELATHLKAQGQIPQALAAFRDAASRRSGFERRIWAPPIVRRNLEQDREAVREYEAVIAANPLRGDAHRGLGMILRRIGDHAAAIPALLAATRADANDGEAFYWLAESHYHLGQRDDALSVVRQSLRRRPGDAPAHALNGLLLAEQNRHAEAIDELEEALRIAPESPEVLYRLGLCHETLGKPESRRELVHRGGHARAKGGEGSPRPGARLHRPGAHRGGRGGPQACRPPEPRGRDHPQGPWTGVSSLRLAPGGRTHPRQGHRHRAAPRRDAHPACPRPRDAEPHRGRPSAAPRRGRP